MLLTKNQFKIRAFFRKNLFLIYNDPHFPTLSFDADKIKNFIAKLSADMKFTNAKHPNAQTIDYLWIYEKSTKDQTEPDISVSIKLYQHANEFFIEII